MIFAIRIVASLIIECRIIGTHTHPRSMHIGTHAHTHTHTHTHTWHAQLAANLPFVNNLEEFPYRTPQRTRFTWARHTIWSRHVEHYVRADYVITRIFVHVLWHSNGTVNDRIFDYCTIHFSTSTYIHTYIHRVLVYLYSRVYSNNINNNVVCCLLCPVPKLSYRALTPFTHF